MAEILNEDILLDEKKKQKKQFYKNWKTYAIGLGIIVIGTGTGLGIYFGVNTNNQTTPKTPISETEISNAIGAANYQVEINKGYLKETVNEKLTADFITTKLNDDIKEAFNLELYHFNKVTVEDHDLNDNDLKKAGIVEAKINYNYGSITNAETNLTIIINDTIDDKDISDDINAIYYTVEVDKGSETTTITEQINGDFIAKELAGDIKDNFKNESFTFNKITFGDHELNNDDLTTARTIETKINYNYGSITNTETNLIITVNETIITDKDIVNSINTINYTIDSPEGGKANDIIKQINADFIAKKLAGDIKDNFKNELFTFNKITVDDHNLNDADLVKLGEVNAKINYDYDSIKDSETSLTITIRPFFQELTKEKLKEFFENQELNFNLDKDSIDSVNKDIKEQLWKMIDDNFTKSDDLEIDKITISTLSLNDFGQLVNNRVFEKTDVTINFTFKQENEEPLDISNLKYTAKITVEKKELTKENLEEVINQNPLVFYTQNDTNRTQLNIFINARLTEKIKIHFNGIENIEPISMSELSNDDFTILKEEKKVEKTEVTITIIFKTGQEKIELTNLKYIVNLTKFD